MDSESEVFKIITATSFHWKCICGCLLGSL